MKKVLLQVNGRDYQEFDSHEDLQWWMKNQYSGDFWEEDPENYPDAEELSAYDAAPQWIDSHTGDEYLVQEIEREMTKKEKIQQVLDRIEKTHHVRFTKSSNNSWYYNTNDTQIRVSDHKRLYPSDATFSHDIDANDTETLYERIVEVL